jgi:serine/threonine protein kinase
MAPEQARGGPVGSAADVWGWGMTLFEAATGERPFAEAWTRISVGPPPRLPQQSLRSPALARRRPRLPRELTRTVDACLEPVPADRPSVAEVATICRRLSGDGPPARSVA